MNKMRKMLKAVSRVNIRSISKPELFFPDKKSANGQAALLLHGYTGSPHDMRYLGNRLRDAGYLVSIPRLPGHGTTRQDFNQTRAEDWLRRSLDAWLELQTFGLEQNLAGLSMGGILAAILAATFTPHRVVLAAPALMVNNPVLPWTPILKYAVKEQKHPTVQDYDDPDLDYLSHEYWSVDNIQGAAELYRLQQLGLSLLGDIQSPLLTIISEKDATVPVAVAPLILGRIASTEKETLVLKESKHVVVNDCEKEAVADAIIAWFGKPLS